MNLNIPILMLVLHFVGDFICQTDWMALNKSKNWKALCLHTLVYSAWFIGYGWAFAGITFLLHTLTDAITSRVTSKLWFISLIPLTKDEQDRNTWTSTFRSTVDTNKRHWFFTMIGFDQLIHFVTLALTYKVLFS